jgi:arsenite methyltransferase
MGQSRKPIRIAEDLSQARAAEIRSAVKFKYREVAAQPEGKFPYPTGKESALNLGYDPVWLDGIPAEVLRRFVGVGNPFRIRAPRPGDRVLDAGCGCGMDTFVAARLAGPQGHACGIDLTTEMLDLARTAAASFKIGNVEFREGSIEALPFENDSFDLVISNGVLNLIPDKAAAFLEMARVLRPEGALAGADLLLVETLPPEVQASTDAWST